MNDSVIEVLVDQKTTIGIKVLKVVLIAATVLMTVWSLFFGIVALLIAVLLGVAAYFVGLRTKVEYEYAYFDKELDVDVIYSMQKRKKVATYDITKLEMLAPASSYHLDEFKNRNYKTADYSSRKAEHEQDVYVMYIGGKDKVVFEPSQEMIKAIRNIAPRKVFTE